MLHTNDGLLRIEVCKFEFFVMILEGIQKRSKSPIWVSVQIDSTEKIQNKKWNIFYGFR